MKHQTGGTGWSSGTLVWLSCRTARV